MGRHGPLTSLALGRSPYDGLVPGDEDAPKDPHTPQQQYDERGRPANPTTKRINKDVIRSHNEVMLAIGVAEPEAVTEAHLNAVRNQMNKDDRLGRTLQNAARVLELGALWMVNGLRSRVFVYKSYADIPLVDLFRYQGTEQSWQSYLLAGAPTSITWRLLIPFCSLFVRDRPCLRGLSRWLQMHLEVHTWLQRLELLPIRPFFPGWKFFVPGTPSSLIPLPPLPTSLSRAGGATWIVGFGRCVLPFAGFWAGRQVLIGTYRWMWKRIYKTLPRPVERRDKSATDKLLDSFGLTLAQTDLVAARAAQTEHVAPGFTDTGVLTRDFGMAVDQVAVLEAALAEPHPHALWSAASGRRGDELHSDDDEEPEIAGATLISFDVEQTEAHDHPQGTWSAELRPNVDSFSPIPALRRPRYRVNSLTKFPAALAADMMLLPCTIFAAPLEALVWRMVIRAYARRHGLPIEGLCEMSFWSWRWLGNVVALHLSHFLIGAEIWGLMGMVVRGLRLSEKEKNYLSGDGGTWSSR